jgi:cytochrome c biogenesis protein CcdA
MNLVPYSLMLAGMVFLLAGLLRIHDHRKIIPHKTNPRSRSIRKRSHTVLFTVGCLLMWFGVFLLVRSFR